MVTKRGAPFRFSSSPQTTVKLIEDSIMLWLASIRQSLAAALLCGIAGLIPGIGLGELSANIMRQAFAILATDYAPWLSLAGIGNPSDALAAVVAWTASPLTWCLLAASMLLGVYGVTVLLIRLYGIAQANDIDEVNAWRAGAARTPACLGAWLAYCAILLLLTLPLLALIVAIFFASVDVGPSGLLLLLALLLLGTILLSIPLAWASVAYGLAPFCSAVAARGPIAAQTASRRLVRGHWTHAAIVISLPMLIYLGAASAISSFALTLSGAATYALSGWSGLLDGRWLLWSQLAALVPTALVLPLAFAGGVVCLNDLILRQAAGR